MSSRYDGALAAALQTFFVEATEMVEQMEQSLLELEQSPGDPELLNALFRSIHTIKGSAGLFGLSRLVAFTHEVETVLDKLRAGTIALSDALSGLLLSCSDHVTVLIEQARTATPDAAPAHSDDALSSALVEQLRGYLEAPCRGEASGATAAESAEEAACSEASADPELWHVSLRFRPEAPARGIDPLATLGYLQELGELVMVETFTTHLPPLSELDPERCHLGFELRICTPGGRAALEEAFEFIEGDCDVRLLPPDAASEAYIGLLDDVPDEAERLGEILVECGALSAGDLHRSLSLQHLEASEGSTMRPLGEVLVAEQLVSPAMVEAALEKQGQVRERSEPARVFRVEAERLDGLINLVGELVIMSATAHAQAARHPELLETTQRIGTLVEEIRNNALSLRMVAIGETFARFKRVVRDISGKLSKRVKLEIEGGDTELDKSVIEKIGDPLMHLVRNALDHGLESPADRLAAGKPEEAVLRLSAQHDSGSIVITIADDGGGINAARVLARARERGLVAAEAEPSLAEIHALIFEPGFSTAETVSDISGRGVGMDVVRQNVEQLRGRIAIRSQEGVGTEIEIRLPLTLAIIDGFLVRTCATAMVIPLEHVEECISAADIEIRNGQALINQRGQPLPIIDVGDVLGLGERSSVARRSVVVVRFEGKRAGLAVDQLLGEHQTVIKPLGRLFQRVTALSGSTILGSGEIALILNINELLNTATGPQAPATGRESTTRSRVSTSA